MTVVALLLWISAVIRAPTITPFTGELVSAEMRPSSCHLRGPAATPHQFDSEEEETYTPPRRLKKSPVSQTFISPVRPDPIDTTLQ
jgi:hypothetical protein